MPTSSNYIQAAALAEALATYEAQMQLMCTCHAAGIRLFSWNMETVDPVCRTLVRSCPSGKAVAQALRLAHWELVSSVAASRPGAIDGRMQDRRANMASGLAVVRRLFLHWPAEKV